MAEMKAIRVAYGEALAALGRENDRVVVLDADLSHATMTVTFQKEFPDRHINVGIAEANLVDMAAGLSTMGFIPFCSTFAVFAGRCYDQIRNGVAYPHFNVKFGFSHAGITLGEDGGSHEAIEDLALMRAIPGMTVLCPGDATETYQAVKAAAAVDGPVYLRLARLPSPVFEQRPFEIGGANVIRDGGDAVILTHGIMVSESLKAAEILRDKGIDAAVVNMYSVKPLNEDMVLRCAARCHNVFCVEEHSVIGGLGDAVGSVLLEKGVGCRFEKIGVKDVFGQSGKPMELLKEYGLSADKIAETVAAGCRA